VVLRFTVAPERWGYWRLWWIDLIIIVPLVAAFYHVPAARSTLVIRQCVVLSLVFWRSELTGRVIGFLGLGPAHLTVLSFATAIGIGTVLLDLPIASASGKPIGIVNALFTITSATCVTGLTVLETGKDFTPFGQLVILGWIQLGGLGIMTFSAFLLVISRGKMAKRYEAHMQVMLGHESLSGVQSMVSFIFRMTLIIELIGASLLFAAWVAEQGLNVRTAYNAVFHSVSAFCNAGFSLYDRSLQPWVSNIPINLTFTSLIIIGGLGFPVVRDLRRFGRDPLTGRHGFSLQTKLVLVTTACLILSGTAALLIAQNVGPLAEADWRTRIFGAYFQSVSARTAGFNTIPIGQLNDAARWALIVLMFIGASPASTGGGIKTTTLAVLVIAMRTTLRSRPEAEVFRKRIPSGILRQAVCIAGLAAALLIVFVFTLCITEGSRTGVTLSDVCFEATSAFGTVGLSTGITPGLTTAGKLLITALMFIGRVGPLTLALAISGERPHRAYRYAEEGVLVG